MLGVRQMASQQDQPDWPAEPAEQTRYEPEDHDDQLRHRQPAKRYRHGEQNHPGADSGAHQLAIAGQPPWEGVAAVDSLTGGVKPTGLSQDTQY